MNGILNFFVSIFWFEKEREIYWTFIIDRPTGACGEKYLCFPHSASTLPPPLFENVCVFYCISYCYELDFVWTQIGNCFVGSQRNGMKKMKMWKNNGNFLVIKQEIFFYFQTPTKFTAWDFLKTIWGEVLKIFKGGTFLCHKIFSRKSAKHDWK